uniref:Uncharacterized protein n=1 Tax=Parascaris univalens TaxID=6257 RepID=A0A915BPK3_PARUN
MFDSNRQMEHMFMAIVGNGHLPHLLSTRETCHRHGRLAQSTTAARLVYGLIDKKRSRFVLGSSAKRPSSRSQATSNRFTILILSKTVFEIFLEGTIKMLGNLIGLQGDARQSAYMKIHPYCCACR